jgi:hypothetical protein
MPKMNVAVCLCCGDILRSKHTHDYVMCGCDNRSVVDGGTDYLKRSGKDLTKVHTCLTMAEARRLSAAVLDKKHASK